MTTETQSQAVQIIDVTDLAAVNGGFDLNQAVQAGNAAAGPGRQAGETLGAGFDAAYQAVRGQETRIGSQVGGPIGAAVGWTGGFTADAAQQLRPAGK
jgi:hypothetical protein